MLFIVRRAVAFLDLRCGKLWEALLYASSTLYTNEIHEFTYGCNHRTIDEVARSGMQLGAMAVRQPRVNAILRYRTWQPVFPGQRLGRIQSSMQPLKSFSLTCAQVRP